MKFIRSNRMQNYLAEYGVAPMFECADGTAVYRKTSKLLSLLDRFEIENYIIKNRL